MPHINKCTFVYCNNEREELEHEVHHLKHRVLHLESILELRDAEYYAVVTNLAELAEYVQDLEKALAEAHLTSLEDKPGTI